MFSVNEGVIYLTRGDDAVIPVLLKIHDEPYEMQEGDSLTLSVRKFGVEELMFSTTSQTSEIVIAHELTDGLEFGKYDADIQLTTYEGKIYTVYPKKDSLNDKQLIGLKAWENFWLVREVTIT